MKDIQIFKNEMFGSIRTIEANGKILFCGSDVAKALGYTKPNNAINEHCKGDTLKHSIIDSLGRTQQARFITEGDLYRLITHSKLESAQKFESWVFDEVLPSIRKHGLYAIDEVLANPDILINALIELKKEREEKKVLAQQKKELQDEVNQLEHALEYDKVSGWKAWNLLKKQIEYKGNFQRLVKEIPLVKDVDYSKKVMGYDKYPTTLISLDGEEKIIDYKECVLDEE